MDIDKPILDFLARSENLPLAFEITEYVDELKAALHISFWKTFNQKIYTKFTETGIQGWHFIEIPKKSFRSQWKYCYLRPLNKPKVPSYIQLFLAQTTKERKYTLARGISWNKYQEGWTHPAIETIHSKAVKLGITRKGKEWIRYEDYPYQLEGLELMQKMAESTEGGVDIVLDDWWNAFIELRPLLEEVNQALAKN